MAYYHDNSYIWRRKTEYQYAPLACLAKHTKSLGELNQKAPRRKFGVTRMMHLVKAHPLINSLATNLGLYLKSVVD
eukprot:7905186-Ditylum_brightwellii.AAC.2